VGDEAQRGLLALLETTQEQQQVTLLVDQRLPEALGTQVALIQALHLKNKEHMECIVLQQRVQVNTGI